MVIVVQTGGFSWFYWDGKANLSASSDRLMAWTEKQRVLIQRGLIKAELRADKLSGCSGGEAKLSGRTGQR